MSETDPSKQLTSDSGIPSQSPKAPAGTEASLPTVGPAHPGLEDSIGNGESEQLSSHLITVYLSASKILGVLVAVVGILVLIGWAFDITILKQIHSSLTFMSANTALGFILIGVVLFLPYQKRPGLKYYCFQVFFYIILFVGLLTLLEHIFHLNLGIDQIFFKEQVGPDVLRAPGRMSPHSALNFMLIGMALVFLDSKTKGGYRPAQLMMFIVGTVALFAFIGYLYGTEGLYSLGGVFKPMALHTALAFLLVFFAILFSRPNMGIMRILSSTTLGGSLARRLLPTAIIVPFVLGFLKLQGERMDLFQSSTGVSLFVVLVIIILVAIISALVIHQHHSEIYRRNSEKLLRSNEEKLRLSEEQFRNAFEKGPVGMTFTAPDGRFTKVNQALCEMLGYSDEEFYQRKFGALTHPDDRAVSQESVRCLLAGEMNEYHFTKRYIHKNGQIVWADVTTTLLRDAANRPVHFVTHIMDISQRKQAEVSMARLAAIMEYANEAIYAVDLNGVVTNWNKGAAQLYGYSDVEAKGKDINFLAPADKRQEVPDIIKRIKAGEIGAHSFETERFRKDGQRIIIALNVSPIKDTSEHIIGFSLMARDVTQRKLMEDKLRENERFLNNVVENIPNMIFVKDAQELRFVRFNKAGEELLGYPRQDLYGKNDYNFFPKEEADFFVAKDREVLNNNQLLDIPEEKIQTKYKGQRILHTKKIPVVDEAGKPQFLLGISEDITERKRMEDQLAESTKFLNSIVENIPNMIFVKDAQELRFVRFNKAGEELLGYPRQDLYGKNDYNFFPKDEADFFIAKDREVLNNSQLLDIPEEKIQTRLKGERILHTKKIPIVDESGKSQYLLGISEDITERKKAEEFLRQYANQLQELNNSLETQTEKLASMNKELEAFSYSVSHDLRAPLRIINGFSEALVEDYGDKLEGQAKEYLKLICNATKQMEQLIDDLLQLSRLSRRPMELGTVNLSEIVKSLAAELTRLEPLRLAQFVIEPGVEVKGDMNLLRVLLDNLLRNAWKFTAKHPKAKIEFGRKLLNGEKVFYVADDGAGFEMTYVGKLFIPFQRLHHAAEFPGTGIGLALVQRIVNRHGGKVWAEGALEKGATIYFTLKLI